MMREPNDLSSARHADRMLASITNLNPVDRIAALKREVIIMKRLILAMLAIQAVTLAVLFLRAGT